MQYQPLGNTDLQVSLICLGTMTWGQQNSEGEAHEQLDLAVERGVNFIDTAEMYPFPPDAESQGRTETCIGNWLEGRSDRDELVIATKVSGNAPKMDWIRGGPRLDARQIREAFEDSLRRLRTDYVDLYQIHWPARKSNYFGKLNYRPEEGEDDGEVVATIEETLEVLATLVDEGRIRHIGVSNETPWGVMQYLRLAERHGWPRIASIQNPYSLLNRSFEVGLAEIAMRERVGLLAYSPLAFGMLTGKYHDGSAPKHARLNRFTQYQRYTGERPRAATARYLELAHAHGITPTALALAFVNCQPFVTANIIGATTREQLEENIASVDVRLSGDVLEALEEIHKDMPYPAP